jgi:hypothetical protein
MNKWCLSIATILCSVKSVSLLKHSNNTTYFGHKDHHQVFINIKMQQLPSLKLCTDRHHLFIYILLTYATKISIYFPVSFIIHLMLFRYASNNIVRLFILNNEKYTGYPSLEISLLFHWFVKQKRLENHFCKG